MVQKVTTFDDTREIFIGLSTDAKPNTAVVTSEFYAYDTGILYIKTVMATNTWSVKKTGAVNANMQMADADVSVSNPLATKDISIPNTPTIYNVAMTTLNTEYSQVLPANCKKFAMKVQLGTGSYKYRVAFVTGKVATPVAPYLQYNDDVEYFEDGLNYATSTLYFASTTSGLVMQIIAWV